MNYKDFVIVIPSYNNAKWAEKNLLSACSQNYPEDKFKIIYTDDCSTDGTPDLVQEFIDKYHINNISLIRNTERKGALHNLYDMIHYSYNTNESSLIFTLDADDFCAHSNVLNRLNKEYQNENVWMTWGSYVDYPQMTRGCSKPFPQNVIESNSYHTHPWCMSHARTFYSKLFSLIKREDLMYQGRMAEMAWDVIFMIKLAQMSAGKFSYIDDILLHYNNLNPISDHKVNQALQGAIDRYARNQPKYQKLDKLF